MSVNSALVLVGAAASAVDGRAFSGGFAGFGFGPALLARFRFGLEELLAPCPGAFAPPGCVAGCLATSVSFVCACCMVASRLESCSAVLPRANGAALPAAAAGCVDGPAAPLDGA